MSTAEWTIPALLQMSSGYWQVCTLHAGVKLDIFTLLKDNALTAAEVAHTRAAEPRAVGMLLDALVALDLLEKRNNTYIDTTFASDNLAKTSPGYMGHIIMHHHYLMEGWSRLDEAVTSGRPVRKSVSHNDSETVRESFLMGMFNLASLVAPRIATSVSLSGCRTLLDLGGGPGTYAVHFCCANPGLTAVVYDLPTTRSFAEGIINRFDLNDRIVFAGGDYHVDPVPTGFDVVWLSHTLHSEGPETCAALLRKAVAALNPNGILMVQEFIMTDTKDGPLFPALFSLNMLLGTDSGQSYSEKELITLMTEAGLSELRRLELDLPNGAGVMNGRKA